VHKILAAFDPRATDAVSLGELAAAQGLPTEAAGAAARFLASPDGERLVAAIRAGRARRELPVALLLGGTLVTGAVDAVLDAPDALEVWDYKTDACGAAELAGRYGTQLAAYALALARAEGRGGGGEGRGGRPVRARLFALGRDESVAVPTDADAIAAFEAKASEALAHLARGEFPPKPGERCTRCTLRNSPLCAAKTPTGDV